MKENYYELTVEPEGEIELFLNLLSSITNDAIEIDKDKLIIRSEDSLDDVLFGLEKFSKALNIEIKTNLEVKQNQDWIKQYQDSVKAIEVGKFFVRPNWIEKSEDKIDIIINPALSFGSGHHETTNTCLQAISKYIQKDDEVIDVGCGSGILSIAASKLGAKVDICDTDEVCIKDSKENFELNSCEYNNAWVGSAKKDDIKTYDVVIANIVADVLIMIHKDLKRCLKEGGILILSGILDKHFNRVAKKYEDLKNVEVIQKNEWITLVLKKGV